jgi:hypothetical protein
MSRTVVGWVERSETQRGFKRVNKQVKCDRA